DGVGFKSLNQLPPNHPLRANPNRLEQITERRSNAERERLSTLRSSLGPLGKTLILIREWLDSDLETKPSDFDHQVFHAPNAEDPRLFVVLKSASGKLRHYAFNIHDD